MSQAGRDGWCRTNYSDCRIVAPHPGAVVETCSWLGGYSRSGYYSGFGRVLAIRTARTTCSPNPSVTTRMSHHGSDPVRPTTSQIASATIQSPILSHSRSFIVFLRSRNSERGLKVLVLCE